MCIENPIEKCSKKLADLYLRKEKLEVDEDAQASPGSELESLIQQINELIEGEYSQVVYDHYSVIKPVLIRVFTGEEIQWLDAFGDSFEQTTRGQRHSLVGLIEGSGKYRFK